MAKITLSKQRLRQGACPMNRFSSNLQEEENNRRSMYSKQEVAKALKTNICKDSTVKQPKTCIRNFIKEQTISTLASTKE